MYFIEYVVRGYVCSLAGEFCEGEWQDGAAGGGGDRCGGAGV